MRFLWLLVVVALLPSEQGRAQRTTQPPPEVLAPGPSIGLVILGMDGVGRKQLCVQLDVVFGVAAESLGESTFEADCDGPGYGRLTIESRVFHDEDQSLEQACGLLDTPVALFASKLDPIALRFSEMPRPWAEIEQRLDRIHVRKLGGLLDAAGFARLRLRIGEDAVLEQPVHQVVTACG